MSKHTPGPWRIVRARGASKAAINGAQIRTEAGLHITSITHVADKPISQKAADARLIAAAPEMLEALKGLMLIHDWMVRAGGTKGPLPEDTIVKFAEMQIPAVDAARAAIAKAEARK